MGRLIFTFYFLLFTFCADAQEASSLQLKQERFIAGSFKNFFSDNLGNIFLLLPNNSIKKINARGDSLGLFNDVRRYGDVYAVDVSNPLKLIVYYKDFSTVVILDRFMNIVNTIDLRRANILQASAVAQSYDNNYWVYDALENKLKKINDGGETLLETADFRILFDETFTPSSIIDDNTQLYLYDEKYGWMIFDYYGAFKEKIPAKNFSDVQVINKKLQGYTEDSLYEINPLTFDEQSFSLQQASGAVKTERQLNLLYTLKNDGLYIYSIQQ